MKKPLLLFCFLIVTGQTFSQNAGTDSVKLFATSLKININGARIGVEQKIFNRTTLQSEGIYFGKNLLKVNPQIRYYLKFCKDGLYYFGIGYYYKHQENDYTDSVRIVGTFPYYSKKFHLSKYIDALTLNGGYLYEDKIFKQTVRFEFNVGLGIRFKKSSRTGLLPNEEIDFREAFIMRPLLYEDTQGKFALYPELNLMFSVVLPLKK